MYGTNDEGSGGRGEAQPLMRHQRSPVLPRVHPGQADNQQAPHAASHTTPGVLARLNNYLKLGNREEDEEEAEDVHAPKSWRKRLGHWLEGRRVQYFFISLLVLDIILLTCELAFEEYFANEESDEWVLQAKEAFEYASVTILLIFAVEVILLLIAFDIKFFTHPFYVLDAIIIGVSLFFDLYLKEALASFLVIFRFWRVIRVVHSIVAAEEERHGETKREKHRLEEELRQYKELATDLQRRLDEKEGQLTQMRDKCASLEQTLRQISMDQAPSPSSPPPSASMQQAASS